MNECSKCMCILHDSRKNNEYSDFYMGCIKENEMLHCMSGNTYIEKYNPNNNIDDYKNCVGLSLF